ncbi:MAG: polysaccharide deacetylase family protein [Anaerolineales bacterium]
MSINLKNLIRGSLRRTHAPIIYKQPSALILMYHRISDEAPEPNWLAVSPGNFQLHLDYINKNLNPISLLDLVEATQAGKIPPNSVTITFDDGYRDNYATALPLLEESGIPATIFVTSGAIDRDKEFWWDEISPSIVEMENFPETLKLVIKGQTFRWKTATYPQRQKLYSDLKGLLKPLREAEILSVLDKLDEWSGASQIRTMRPTYRTMTKEELIELSRSEFIEIGAHTITHPALNTLMREEQLTEIKMSRQALESIIGQPVCTFAYPFGYFSEETMELVRSLGFKAALTTETGVIRAYDDLFRLNRCAVNDYGVDIFAMKITEWFGR